MLVFAGDVKTQEYEFQVDGISHDGHQIGQFHGAEIWPWVYLDVVGDTAVSYLMLRQLFCLLANCI